MISVIIPVYNTKQYLRKCVRSVAEQSADDLEILLVDDGSTDGSGALCDELAREDGRIRVIHQENGGLSAARNAGIEHAGGSFLMFLDSDDCIRREMLSRLSELQKEYDADIVCCGFENFQDRELMEQAAGEQRQEQIPPENQPDLKVFRGRDCMKVLLLEHAYAVIQCIKLFRREIFENLRFPVSRYHEDEFVIHEELAAAGTVVCTQEAFYLYYRHGDSITGTPSAKKLADVLDAYEQRAVFLKQHGYTQELNRVLNSYTDTAMQAILTSDGRKTDGEGFKARLREMRARYHEEPAVRSVKNTLKAWAVLRMETICRIYYRKSFRRIQK